MNLLIDSSLKIEDIIIVIINYYYFAAVERTQQRKLEELLLAAAREGKAAELIALVKTKLTNKYALFILHENINVKFICT